MRKKQTSIGIGIMTVLKVNQTVLGFVLKLANYVVI